MCRFIRLVLPTVCLLLLPTLSHADTIRITTWNIAGTHFDGRGEEFSRFGKRFHGDLLFIQELLSAEQMRQFQNTTHLGDMNARISDFSEDNVGSPYSRLEVGVLSPHPIGRVIEYDLFLDDDNDANDRLLPSPEWLPAHVADVGAERGFLWVELPEKALVAVCVHLKSSSGRNGVDDFENASKRERVVAAVAHTIAVHKRQNPDWSYVVAGDFNVAAADAKKVGYDLDHVCGSAPCMAYDQTHAILRGGYADGVAMRHLTEGLGHTYVDHEPRFADAPIDVIYVAGPLFEGANEAVARRLPAFGSDHYPVTVEVRQND